MNFSASVTQSNPRRLALRFLVVTGVLLLLPAAGLAQTEQERFDQGKILFDAGDYEQAATVLQPLGQSAQPDLACQATFYYARSLHYLGKDYPAVKSLYLTIPERWPGSTLSSSAVLYAGYAALKTDYTEARTLFERVVADYPDSEDAPHAKLRLAYIAAKDKDLVHSEQLFWEAATDPKQITERRAAAYTQYGFVAIQSYFQAAGAHQDSATTHLVNARQRLEEASQWLKSQPGFGANAALCQAGIAESYLWEQRPAEAETSYRLILTGFGEDIPVPLQMLARHGLAISLFRQLKQEEALEQLVLVSSLVEQKPEGMFSIPIDFIRFDSGVLRAMILQRLGRSVEALAAIEPFAGEAEREAYKNAPMLWVGAQALIQQGHTLSRLHRIPEAVAKLQKVIELYSQAEQHVGIARALQQRVMSSDSR